RRHSSQTLVFLLTTLLSGPAWRLLVRGPAALRARGLWRTARRRKSKSRSPRRRGSESRTSPRACLRGSDRSPPRSGSDRGNGPFLLLWSVLFAAYQRFQLTAHSNRPSVDRQHNRVEVY